MCQYQPYLPVKATALVSAIPVCISHCATISQSCMPVQATVPVSAIPPVSALPACISQVPVSIITKSMHRVLMKWFPVFQTTVNISVNTSIHDRPRSIILSIQRILTILLIVCGRLMGNEVRSRALPMSNYGILDSGVAKNALVFKISNSFQSAFRCHWGLRAMSTNSLFLPHKVMYYIEVAFR